jgi:hypothetical protein
MENFFRVRGIYNCLYGRTSGIFGLKYQSDAAVPVKFAAPECK